MNPAVLPFTTALRRRRLRPRRPNVPSKVAQVAAVRAVAAERRERDPAAGILIASVCPGMVGTAASSPRSVRRAGMPSRATSGVASWPAGA
ncbi:hypothetical protein ACFVH0_10490 [Streptomyces sp. NPDC127117]|uniref:hypothetical protein n=1 Tax=Streptomyces sp. NPDC127117 TaxID=3345368 RepID=UPI003639D16C